jgi:hypothetical protein
MYQHGGRINYRVSSYCHSTTTLQYFVATGGGTGVRGSDLGSRLHDRIVHESGRARQDKATLLL